MTRPAATQLNVRRNTLILVATMAVYSAGAAARGRRVFDHLRAADAIGDLVDLKRAGRIDDRRSIGGAQRVHVDLIGTDSSKIEWSVLGTVRQMRK